MTMMTNTAARGRRSQVDGRRHRVAVFAIGTLLLCGCAGPRHAAPAVAAAPVPNPEVLRVGIAPVNPPLAFKRGKDGAIGGVEAEFARRLGSALGMEVRFVETQWEALIPALRERRVDIIMSGMTVTDSRRQLVSFVHPYLRVGQMLLLREADARRFREDTAINRAATTVGFVSNTTGEDYARSHFAKARPRGFNSVDAVVTGLASRQVDVVVLDGPAVWAATAASRNSGTRLVGRYEPRTEEYLAWAVRQDDTALQTRLNTVLAQWNRDGTLEDVLDDWIKIQRSPPKTR